MSGALKESALRQTLDLLATVSLGFKCQQGSHRLAHFAGPSVKEKKRFLALTPVRPPSCHPGLVPGTHY